MQNIQLCLKKTKSAGVILLAIIFPFFANAQANITVERNPLQPKVKVEVHLYTDSIVRGYIALMCDSTITLDVKAPANKNNTVANTGTLPDAEFYTIRTENIKSIKVKRNAVLSGLAAGGLIGYGLGYAAGYITHTYDDAQTSDQNDADQKTRATGGGIIGAVSFAAVGGIIAPVILRKKFVVNGKRENMAKVVKLVNNTL